MKPTNGSSVLTTRYTWATSASNGDRNGLEDLLAVVILRGVAAAGWAAAISFVGSVYRWIATGRVDPDLD